MKNKLFIPAITACAIAPAIAITSCGNQKSESEKIIDAIIAPTKSGQTPTSSLLQELKNLNDEGKKQEVIYDLFGMFNLESNKYFKFEKSLSKMWENNAVSFKTNITKCLMSIDNDNKITSSFLGYVSFVFNDTTPGKLLDENTGNYIEVEFKANDYIMITYDFFNANVTLADNYSLKYEPKLSKETGFWKIKYNNGNDETLYDAGLIDTNSYNIKNSKNWVPNK